MRLLEITCWIVVGLGLFYTLIMWWFVIILPYLLNKEKEKHNEH